MRKLHGNKRRINGFDVTPEIEYGNGRVISIHTYHLDGNSLGSSIYSLTKQRFTEHRLGYERFGGGPRIITEETLKVLESSTPNPEENLPLTKILGASASKVKELFEEIGIGYYQTGI